MQGKISRRQFLKGAAAMAGLAAAGSLNPMLSVGEVRLLLVEFALVGIPVSCVVASSLNSNCPSGLTLNGMELPSVSRTSAFSFLFGPP